MNCYTEEYFVVFCAENVSVCGFNDNRNYNFFLESVLKNRVRIIYGCALYTGKYGMLIVNQKKLFRQSISKHFQLESGVKMTRKRCSFLATLFFTCLVSFLFINNIVFIRYRMSS